MGFFTKIKEFFGMNKKSEIGIIPATPLNFTITSALDYNADATKNRVWYRGDSYELEQLYQRLKMFTGSDCFWGANSSTGQEILKRHSGLPAVVVDMLSSIVTTDLNDISFEDELDGDIWTEIETDNKFTSLVSSAVREALVVGDGAFKISFDDSVSDVPVIEFYGGDRVEYKRNRGRLTDVIFKTVIPHTGGDYTLYEDYGYGYIKNRLFRGGNEVSLADIPETRDLSDVWFGGYAETEDGTSRGGYMMAVPLCVFKSSKYDGRGRSIFDGKIENYDSLDEVLSQWMDALRSGRSREYIPDTLLPRNPKTGEVMKANAFDNRFIQTDSDMSEGAKNQISLVQPTIPHESYLQTYITFLDLCLQGVISPSTLGIDTKKLDNAEAQREKEKTTLYTRAAIIDALTETLKTLAEVSVRSLKEMLGETGEVSEAMVSFGEYANPSFESQVETVAKAKTAGVMSVEACVEELYGDTRTDDWKAEEVERLKAQSGLSMPQFPWNE